MKKVELFVMALAFFLLFSPELDAQCGFVDKLYYSFNVVGSRLGKDIGSLDVEQRVGLKVCDAFGVYVPVTVSESLYNRSTTKNYDFQAKLGLVWLTVISSTRLMGLR